MEPAHPERWRLVSSSGGGGEIEDASGRHIATVYAQYDAHPGADTLATILAAPRLRAALQELTIAASARENTQGDPLTLLDAQARLRRALATARHVLGHEGRGAELRGEGGTTA